MIQEVTDVLDLVKANTDSIPTVEEMPVSETAPIVESDTTLEEHSNIEQSIQAQDKPKEAEEIL